MRGSLLPCLAPVAVLASAVVGCGSDEQQGTGESEAVAGVVERLQAATRERDAAAICRDLYARETVRSLEQRPGGCVGRVKRAFVKGTGGVTAKARDVKVDGNRATARVDSRAPSGKRASDIFRFTREGGRWRIVVSE